MEVSPHTQGSGSMTPRTQARRLVQPLPSHGRPLPAPRLEMPQEGQALRVVVADADPDVRQFYQEALVGLGHQVCLAATGSELAEHCLQAPPGLLILHASLPGLFAARTPCAELPVP